VTALSRQAVADVGSLAAAFAAGDPGSGQPGVAWGIVAEGGLAHHGGFGSRRCGGPEDGRTSGGPPDADTVFRIASMTKSFTAAAVLLLRDAGALALDDPVADHVPEVAHWSGPTADSPRLTIRHLLTMSAGLPTDDPWADRQQGQGQQEFSAFLRGGVRFAWVPGTTFEYSNLGYAILGRVVAAAAGAEYAEVLGSRLLRPLGLTATVLRAQDVPQRHLATGHRAVEGGWEPVPFDGYGAFAPMGGLFSSVRDLARWIAGLLDAFPPRDDAEGPHPLCRATRRELQQEHRAVPPRMLSTSVDAPTTLHGGAYGYGLLVEHDPLWGPVVGHSGGYPGFGSHMRWHPESGLGVVVLANSTYAPAQPVGARMLAALLTRRATAIPSTSAPRLPPGGPRVRPQLLPAAPAPGRPWPETLAACADVEVLLEAWDDGVAERLFASNVGLDEPLDRRRAGLEAVRARVGPVRGRQWFQPEHDSPAHCRWWLRAASGAVRLEIRLSPQSPPRVQSLVVVALPDPSPAFGATLRALVAVTHDPVPTWPAAVAAAGGLDAEAAGRALRVGADVAGPQQIVGLVDGDGERKATLRLTGPRGDLVMSVETDRDGAVCGFRLARAEVGYASTD
jgi:CubicO group peptidase (beta-lactamase class C family)